MVRSPGIWKVVARFSNTRQKTFTAVFEVKEYGKTCVIKLLLFKNMISQIMCLFIYLCVWLGFSASNI